MRRFAFRLEHVLKLRRAREDAALAELASARRTLALEQMALEQRRARARRALQEARRRREQGEDPALAAGLTAFLEALEDDVRLQEEAVSMAEEEVQSRLQAALEAMKERKAMEKLRERRLAEHLAEAAREDIRAMDEAAALRAASNR
jgi:flagellar FliJ protein